MEQELACLCTGATQLGSETCVQCVCAVGGGGGGGGGGDILSSGCYFPSLPPAAPNALILHDNIVTLHGLSHWSGGYTTSLYITFRSVA